MSSTRITTIFGRVFCAVASVEAKARSRRRSPGMVKGFMKVGGSPGEGRGPGMRMRQGNFARESLAGRASHRDEFFARQHAILVSIEFLEPLRRHCRIRLLVDKLLPGQAAILILVAAGEHRAPIGPRFVDAALP